MASVQWLNTVMRLFQLLLCALIVLLATAQSELNVTIGTGVHSLTIDAETCTRVRLGTEEQERASYSVITLPSVTVRYFLFFHCHSGL